MDHSASAQNPQSSPANTGGIASTTSVWHPTIPGLQVIWDSTSLRMLMECPRKYQLHQIEGWTTSTSSIHLIFGSAVGDALETYYKGVIEEGLSKDRSRLNAMRRLLELLWDEKAGASRTGLLLDMWHCEGTTPFRNAKGNKAKCPYSHKGKLFLSERPTTCSCGSPTVAVRKWTPYEPTKDTKAALRMLIWYTDDQHTSNLLPMSLDRPDGGRMALFEVPWTIPLGKVNGIEFWAAGWFDSIKGWGPSGEQSGVKEGPMLGSSHDGWYVSDFKTTKNSLTPSYWSQYWPNPQVGLYDAVASTFNIGAPYMGVMIEAFQLMRDGMRTGVRPFTLTPTQRTEFLRNVSTTLALATAYQSHNYYPQNPTACKLCEFKSVCAAPPESRGQILASAFIRERWNPLTRTKEPVSCPDASAENVASATDQSTSSPLSETSSPSSSPAASSGASLASQTSTPLSKPQPPSSSPARLDGSSPPSSS